MSDPETNTSDGLHHLAAAYALDALDPDECRRFETHYPSCEICAREVDEFRATAAMLAAAVAAEPPPDLRARVLGEAARTRQLSPLVPDRVTELDRRRRAARRPGPAGLLLGAAAVLLVVAGAIAAVVRAAGHGEAPDEVAQVIEADDAVLATLVGDDGNLRLAWSPGLGEVALLGDGLVDPGPGRVYQLWVLRADGVSPAGLFRPRDDGSLHTVLAVDDVGGEGFGVTIEPEGGSTRPTSPVIYDVEL